MNYDLAVIGAGWAGFNAAVRARDLGLKVALVEKGELGGTCLNRGCIPTKTLIHCAKIYYLAKKSHVFGIETTGTQVNFTKIQERKEKIVQQLRQGMQFALKGVEFLNAQAQILSPQELKVGNQVVTANSMIIATGSKVLELDGLKCDGKKIISSDGLLTLREIPRSLLIIGGGVIGCEFASLFCNLGTQISVVELLPQLLPGIDNEIAKKLENIFKKKAIKVYTNTDAQKLDFNNYDLVLLSIGRVPEARDLDLEKIGIKLNKGKIMVDEYLKTGVRNIYAAGDCTAKNMLAHFAAYQGRIAAENIVHPGSLKKSDNPNIPSCIFTDPEISSVGLSEEQAKACGLKIKINRFDFLGSGMARILDETDGVMKIISDEKTKEFLGATIIGPRATELIGILTIAISNRLTVPQVKDTIFAHPTLSESLTDALKENHVV